MKYLVLGGAGYIGSHLVLAAQEKGHECLVYDNLSTGHRAALPRGVRLMEEDLLNQSALAESLVSFRPDAIFHFAALALVSESVAQPQRYYHNNVEGVANLLDAMIHTGCKAPVIFSSTCAVFGLPARLPIAEDDAKAPVSPYGRAKLAAEWLLEDYSRAFDLKTVALRYFNACGAHGSGKIGEAHEPESHLIPNILKAAASGKAVTIFGSDFPTRDGTCVRDYIHVMDLVESHLLAADFLAAKPKSYFETFHLGSGDGYSNLEVVRAAGKVLGKEIAYEFGPRRPGDPPELVASCDKAGKVLGFKTRHSGLENIISTAWNWHRKNPNAFS